MWDLENMRKAYQNQAEAEGECPNTDIYLTHIVDQKALPDEVLDHLLTCTTCCQDVKDLRQMHERIDRKKRPNPLWLIVAAAVAFFALGFWPQPSTTPTIRNQPEFIVTVPAHMAQLDSWPATFDWPDMDNAASYHFSLYDQNGQLITQKKWLQQSQVSIEPIETDQRLFWQVDVNGPTNQQRLGPFQFQAGK